MYTYTESNGKYLVTGDNYKAYFTEGSDAEKFVLEQNKTIFEEAKAEKTKELHDKYQAQVDAIKASVPDYEAETWDAQKDEWIAWNADNAALTPLVDTIATARSIDREALLGKIGIKVLAIFQILGTQQGIEDQINACTTKEELDAISI